MSLAVLNYHFYFETQNNKKKAQKVNKPHSFDLYKIGLACTINLLLLGLLGEATVVGCKLYSVTSDPETQREGPEEENKESKHEI